MCIVAVEMKGAGSVGRPSKYRQPKVFTTKFENDILTKYTELMKLQGKHVNEGLQAHMQEQVDLYGDDAQGILDKWLHDPKFLLSGDFNSEDAIIRKVLEECSDKRLEEILDKLDIWQQLVDKVKLDRRVRKAKQEYEKPIVVPTETARDIDGIFDAAAKK